MIVITTLAENHYFYGVAALINSIIKNGTYADKMIVGYRGNLPKWLPTLHKTKNGRDCTLDNGFVIEFVPVNGDLHMVHEKPKWFRYLTEVLEPKADEYFFFDSDIIILRRMSFFGEWVKQGVALCEDVNYDMSNTHPIRKQWAKLAIDNGKRITNQFDRYFNSGFLGWNRDTSQFVVDWDECSQILSKLSGDMKKFRVYDRTYIVLSTNQDSLNLAAMTTNCPISTIGPDAMGFRHGLQLMAHPLGAKPWKQKFIKDFFYGKSPRYADLLFWQFVNGNKIKPYSNYYVKYKIVLIKLLRFFSRFYGKK